MSDTQLQKLTITSTDDQSVVTAQFNPKEIQIDKTVPWQKHKTSKGDDVVLEYSGGEARTMSLELFFDNYETGVSVEGQVAQLVLFGKVRNINGSEDEKRPHLCIVVWGASAWPSFKGVIESVSTKYTMFKSDGTPIRATCNIKMKEAQSLKVKASGGGGH
jgi:hypothetical protein